MKVFIVAGLAFGDEGKGTMVDFLCRKHKANWVVRYNGGPQAAHNVVLPNGLHHTFSQFGSGTFVPGCWTYLSEYMLIEPYAMLLENVDLQSSGVHDGLDRLLINPKSVIITPWHWRANRLKEMSRGKNRHGSCGMGIGEARADQLDGLFLEVSDIRCHHSLERLKWIKATKLQQCKKFINSEETQDLYDQMEYELPESVRDFYLRAWLPKVKIGTFYDVKHSIPNAVVFEGSQGVLLDETHGFGNHVTWTDCTFNNALEIIKYGVPDSDITTIGVVRTYFTRHGAGPFVTESADLLMHGLAPRKDHNENNKWQGNLRIGYFDATAFKYALKTLNVLRKVDELAVTHMDALNYQNIWIYADCYRSRPFEQLREINKEIMENHKDYSYGLRRASSVINGLSEIAPDIPVRYLSFGNTHIDKRMITKE
jgi:adenylosuccinate synthase